MLPDHSWYCAGWQVWQVSGSMSALWESVDVARAGAAAGRHGDAQRDEGNTSQHLHEYEVCSSAPRVSQFDREPATAFEGRSLSRSRWRHSGAKSRASSACRPPVVACPDGGGPSFEGEVLPIFKNVCDNCHAPDASMSDRADAVSYQLPADLRPRRERGDRDAIEVQVFYNCAMPPATASVQLNDGQRQTLHVWLACGAPNSPASTRAAGD